MSSPNPMGIISGLMGFYGGRVLGLCVCVCIGEETGNYWLRVLG